jgi:VIT1/CCC1 family predicted Fe2+/Mn2+ transporter
MTAPQTLQRLQTLIWVLIYGGLLTLVLGIATARSDGAVGWTLGVVGGLAAAAGVVLIAVRARFKPDAGG